jgi:hypothetical protein
VETRIGPIRRGQVSNGQKFYDYALCRRLKKKHSKRCFMPAEHAWCRAPLSEHYLLSLVLLLGFALCSDM